MVSTIREHDSLAASGVDLRSFDESLKVGLCLNPKAQDFDRKYFLQWNGSDYEATYMIGVQWINTGQRGVFPLAVLPKIDNVDFLKMFMRCFDSPYADCSFHNIYGIDFEAGPIECDSLENILSPLLVARYLASVKRILRKGLRRNYLNKSENLSKIKGRVALSANLKNNTLRGRRHRIFCAYQEYTCDTIENRILKRALVISKSVISKTGSSIACDLLATVNSSLSLMCDVADRVTAGELRAVKHNRIYREYNEAVAMAKVILRRYDFSLSESATGNTAKMPPFWIDMPLLFEHYIGGILADRYPDDIIYQADGSTGRPDFLSKSASLILDTKYMPRLAKSSPDTDIIRQLAGYSRDRKILDRIHADYRSVVPCAFIYPDDNAPAAETVFSAPLPELLSPESGHAVDGLTDFYKIPVRIPTLSKPTP